MTQLQDRLERLSSGKRRLLARWLAASQNRPHPSNPSVSTEQNSTRVRLIAYVACGDAAMQRTVDADALNGSQLRDYLLSEMPPYMVPDTFVILPALPRTPGGKIDTQALPDPASAEHIDADHYVAPGNDVEKKLAAIWKDLLGLELVGVHDDFFEIGGDSILSIQVISRAREAGILLEPKQMVDHPNVAELAAIAVLSTESRMEPGPATGLVPLTPIQHWFFEMQFPVPHHWNQSQLLVAASPIDRLRMKEAIGYWIRHHDMLRARFDCVDHRWRQIVAEADDLPDPFRSIDIPSETEDDFHSALQQHLTALQAGLDLARGPLVCVAHFRSTDEQHERLCVIIHHLVVDILSWNILLEDLDRVYTQLCRSEPYSFPAKTSSYQAWATNLAEHARSVELTSELDFWLDAADGGTIPVDIEGQPDLTEDSARTVQVRVEPSITQLLQTDAHKAYNTKTNDLLITALLAALHRWTGESAFRIDLELHGRQPIGNSEIDVARTVGWFNAYFPVTLPWNGQADLGDALVSVKEQLRAIPNGGMGYGILRYLCPDEEIRERMRAVPYGEVLFNYAGTAGAVSSADHFQPVSDEQSTARAPRNQRSHLLEINAAIVDGQLRVDWIFSESAHLAQTIELVAHMYREELIAIVEHCVSAETGRVTPSDFPEANLSQDELDTFFDSLD